ncbi:MAG: TetR/AcrR family transcriptional regulator [Ilumatobacteraceae bacterium]
MATSSVPSSGDGRRRRREAGRAAVLDALIDLVLEHGAPPAADDIADRAGVSSASLFRYYPSLDELREAAIGRYFERFDTLISLPESRPRSTASRIRTLVEARLTFYDHVAPMARLARRQAALVPALRCSLDRVRSIFVEQLAIWFEDELARFPPKERRQRIAVLAALTSFEAWDQLGESGLDRDQLNRALRRSLADLLGPTSRRA